MIGETYNYDMFKLANWNRDIKERTLAKIDNDVKKNGWKKHPILVNKEGEIIDGQHRYVYAKMHGLPVFYILIDELDIEDCVTLNNVRTAWSAEDYVKLYSSQGNKNYIKLGNLLSEYSFAGKQTICSLIKNETAGGGSSKKLREGKYILTDEEFERAKAKLDFIEELNPYIRSIPGRQTAIYAGVAFCYDCPEIDNQRLKKQIKTRISTITPPVSIPSALQELEYVYNYKIPQDEYVYIFNEYEKLSRAKRKKSIKR